MTEVPDESAEKSPESNPNEPISSPPPEPVSSEANPTSESTSETTTGADEGLPEWEPLTPELVEDEAIRGDFVLRWVVVGLALLLGVSQITETKTLLHLKSGQYLIGHGFLPGSKDVFSSTAANQRWVNLSWLFDIIAAGVYSISGGIGLSLVQGLIACTTFGLLAHAVRSSIRTWWGSICAVMALLVCYTQFTILPELVTLLGIGFLLWVLVQSEEIGKAKLLWWIVPAMWVWAQCDPHAWMGLFLLILWSIGELASRIAAGDGRRGLLLKVSFASLIAMAIHPFLWETWLASVQTYLTEYPAIRAAYPAPTGSDIGYYGIGHENFWAATNHRTVAALFLVLATLVTMVLNAGRTSWSHVIAFVGFNALACVATHELAVASLVNCTICTLNAQSWYRNRFGQVYSIDWRELFFSRGGRAVTVFSFFILAWLILSGRIDGPAGKRTGVGFDIYLANAMQDYQDMATSSVDDRPFNFSIRQGDLVVWGGLKSFIDSRVSLFYGGGESSVMSIHKRTRLALQKRRNNREGSGRPSVWKESFEKYGLRQAWPRLHGVSPVPDYTTLEDLLDSKDFQLTELNASAAVFVRTDPADATAVAYLAEHPFDPVELAFRKNSTQEDEGPRDFAKPATTYDNLFSRRRPSAPREILHAQHLERLARKLASTSGENGALAAPACAATLLAIRRANEGLRVDPNCVEGYRILGLAYAFFGQVEVGIAASFKQAISNRLRYYQTVAALQQGLALAPDDANLIKQLILQYQQTGRIDLQLQLVRKLIQMLNQSDPDNTQDQQERERLVQAANKLEEQVTQIENATAEYLRNGTDRMQVAGMAYQAGCLLVSIKSLEEDAIYLTQNPMAKLSLASWLMEAGRCREAAEMFDSLQALDREGSITALADPAATMAVIAGNDRRSIQLWNDNLKKSTGTSLQQTLSTLPFTTLNAYWTGPDAYPTANVASAAQLIQQARFGGTETLFQIAVVQMEMGAVEDALKTMRQGLETNPRSPYVQVFRFYIECLSGDKLDPMIEELDEEEFEDLAPPVDQKPDETKSESGTKQKSDTEPADANSQAEPQPQTELKPGTEVKPEEQPKPDSDPKPQ